MWLNPPFSPELVTFTKEILNGKFHFFVQWMREKSNDCLLEKSLGNYAPA